MHADPDVEILRLRVEELEATIKLAWGISEHARKWDKGVVERMRGALRPIVEPRGDLDERELP